MPLNRTVSASALALVAALAPSLAGGASLPPVKNPEALAPRGMNIEYRLDVDLDGDGDKDVAMIAVKGVVPAPEQLTSTDGDGNRVLVIAAKDADGYRLAGFGKHAVQCRRCGGAFWGVVPAGVQVAYVRGAFVVTQQAGSRELVTWTHRYRIEPGRGAGNVRLIGVDRKLEDRTQGGVVTVSRNLLTGRTITTVKGTVDNPPKPGTVKGAPSVVFLEAVRLT